MRDPWEGTAPDGTIVTGVGLDRVRARYRRVLDAAVALVDPGDVSSTAASRRVIRRCSSST